MIILVIINFLFYNLVSQLVTIVTNNFLSLKLIVNERFSYSATWHSKIELANASG